MAKERRDSKNRLLGKGEYQKPDGRYMYRYTDATGTSRFVYSWTLTKTDRAPSGKSSKMCLRDMEKEIARDIADGIRTAEANKNSLNHYFEKYIEQKGSIRPGSRRNYRMHYNLYVKDTLGNRKIGDIRYSDIKKLYSDLFHKSGLKIGTILNINTVLHPLFGNAVRDGLIRSNPTDGVISELKKETKAEIEKRHALTIEEQTAFVDFVKENKRYSHWLPIITFLLGTGCRIGETVGLTWDDCDFERNIISINHSMSYQADEITGVSSFSINEPKTKAGIREIPMFEAVRDLLWNERMIQLKYGFCDTEVDGYSGFVFVNKDRSAYAPKNINAALIRIANAYNKQELITAEKEGRKPLVLPHFTAHHLRHTFCTRLCEIEPDVKLIQEIMGHASIKVTMDIYNEVSETRKKASFEKHEGKIKIC